MTASSSAWPTSAGRCSWTETMPTSAQSACFMATYRALAGSSPTRTVPRPGRIPAFFSSAVASATSARMRAATVSPFRSWADTTFLSLSVPEVALGGEHHGGALLVGGGHHIAVLHRPARLDHDGHPGGGQ